MDGWAESLAYFACFLLVFGTYLPSAKRCVGERRGMIGLARFFSYGSLSSATYC